MISGIVDKRLTSRNEASQLSIVELPDVCPVVGLHAYSLIIL